MAVINSVKDGDYIKMKKLISENYSIHPDTLMFTLNLEAIKFLVDNGTNYVNPYTTFQIIKIL